jgi:hypothetical protein
MYNIAIRKSNKTIQILNNFHKESKKLYKYVTAISDSNAT